MQNFNIVKKTEISNSFRCQSVVGQFDLNQESMEQSFVGEIELPNKWSIGLIVGASGSGKTTIAKHLYPNAYIDSYEYTHDSILDDMPADVSVTEICKTLNSVGFSSPPSWLKRYAVLSNGEKMRCDLARAILSNDELFVFDEFTSVVDRNVAKIGSYAVQKAIRATNKQFIAISCHYDVEDWLLPDWVFDTNTMSFKTCSSKKDQTSILEFSESVKVKKQSIGECLVNIII